MRSVVGQVQKRSGFTLVEIMIVVATIALLAVIAVPAFARARSSTQVRLCVQNLKVLTDAKQQWALENGLSELAIPTSANIVPYLRSGQMPVCPANGTYRLRRVSRPTACTLYSSGHTLNNLNLDDDPLAD